MYQDTLEIHGQVLDVRVDVHHYRIDGSQIRVEVTHDEMDRWATVFDSRVISDSFWESMMSALCQGLEIDGEFADSILCGWGIEPPPVCDSCDEETDRESGEPYCYECDPTFGEQ